MRKGKLMVEHNDFGCNIKEFYEIMEVEVGGSIFYIDKKYREEMLGPDNELTIDDRNSHICNWYNNSDYLQSDVLAKHFEAFESSATLTWLEPLTEMTPAE